MVCLDSDFLVAFLRGYPEAGKTMSYLLQTETRLTTTPINAYELYHGAYASARKQENLEKVRILLLTLEILTINEETCEKAGRIRATLESQGIKIGDADSLIAGTALNYGETIITRNIGHFSRIDELEIERW
jgi:tRNA(fMet)-specific endonuclease VapC